MSGLPGCHARAMTLARRLVGRYLMFALGSVFVCLSLAIGLSIYGVFTDYAHLVAAAAVALLAIGACVLWRMVYVNAIIEQQLRQMSDCARSAPAILKPLPASDATALGWNAVLQHLRDNQFASLLEARLSELGGVADGKRWESIFQAIQDGVAVCDRDEVVLLANNALRALLGLENGDQAVGRKLGELLDAQTGGTATVLLRPALHTSAPLMAELRKGASWPTASGV